MPSAGAPFDHRPAHLLRVHPDARRCRRRRGSACCRSATVTPTVVRRTVPNHRFPETTDWSAAKRPRCAFRRPWPTPVWLCSVEPVPETIILTSDGYANSFASERGDPTSDSTSGTTSNRSASTVSRAACPAWLAESATRRAATTCRWRSSTAPGHPRIRHAGTSWPVAWSARRGDPTAHRLQIGTSSPERQVPSAVLLSSATVGRGLIGRPCLTWHSHADHVRLGSWRLELSRSVTFV